MARRTKAQIRHDEYVAMVNSYKYFIVSRKDLTVYVGYEYKQDCIDDMECCGEEKRCMVKSKKALMQMGVPIQEIIHEWSNRIKR